MRFRYIGIFFSIFLLLPFHATGVDLEHSFFYLKRSAFATHRTSESDWALMAYGLYERVSERDMFDATQLKSATDYARFLLTLTAHDIDPHDFLGRDITRYFLETFVHGDGIGGAAVINDDAWGVLALRASGIPADDFVIQRGIQFLQRSQNTDGGWSIVQGGKSSVDMTAAALLALHEGGVVRSHFSVVQGIRYLLDAQNFDGGLPFYPKGLSNGASTAWALSALSVFGEIESNVIHRAREYLQTLQQFDGSFANEKGGASSVLTTAYAVIALSGKGYPVKKISDFRFSISDEEKNREEEYSKNKNDLFIDQHDHQKKKEHVEDQKNEGAKEAPDSEEAQSAPFDSIGPKGAQRDQQPTVNSDIIDSDGDGYPDDVEIANGYDPFDPTPCPKREYSRTTRNVYGGMRLANLYHEQCRSRHLRSELHRAIETPLRISAQRWHMLVNAYLYGGYELKDIAMAAVGIQNIVHETIPKTLNPKP